MACLTGNGECARGPSHSMTWAEPSADDIFTAKRILIDTVLPEWAERAGGAWVAKWNDSVGKVAKIKLAVPGE